MANNKKISLIDGSGFIFRAYYALPSLTSKNGVPIGAVLGFCNMLYKIIQEKESDKVIVIFDTSKKTFRSKIYKNYKANRGDPPEDLIPQFSIITTKQQILNNPTTDDIDKIKQCIQLITQNGIYTEKFVLTN